MCKINYFTNLCFQFKDKHKISPFRIKDPIPNISVSPNKIRLLQILYFFGVASVILCAITHLSTRDAQRCSSKSSRQIGTHANWALPKKLGASYHSLLLKLPAYLTLQQSSFIISDGLLAIWVWLKWFLRLCSLDSPVLDIGKWFERC